MPKPKNAMPEKRLLRIACVLLMRSEPLTRDEIWSMLPDDYPMPPAGADPAERARAFDRNERKWSRDKAALKEAGVPIRVQKGETEREEAYFIDRNEYLLPDPGFSAEELSALRIAGAAATRLPGHPFALELESALRKLRWLEDGAPAPAPRTLVAFPARAMGARESEHIDVLRTALRLRKRVTFTYRSPASGAPTERAVDVYGIAWRRGMWLFAGHCHLRNALRVFYLSRVEKLSMHTANPSTPDYEIPREFDIRVFSQQQVWEYWAHPPMEVQVLFRPSAEIRPLGEALIAQQLPGAAVRTTPEGVVATVVAHDVDSLVRHVFSLGLDAEFVAPPAARAAARAMLERIVAGGAV